MLPVAMPEIDAALYCTRLAMRVEAFHRRCRWMNCCTKARRLKVRTWIDVVKFFNDRNLFPTIRYGESNRRRFRFSIPLYAVLPVSVAETDPALVAFAAILSGPERGASMMSVSIWHSNHCCSTEQKSLRLSGPFRQRGATADSGEW